MPPGGPPDVSFLNQYVMSKLEGGKQALLDVWRQNAEATGADQVMGGGGGAPGRVVAIEDGTGQALATRVNSDNNLGTEARYGRISVAITNQDVGLTSEEVLGLTPGRLQLTLQNLDDTHAIHFRLGGGTATTSDPRLDPGQSFSLPPGIAFEGNVTAKATGTSAILSIMEYKL